MLRRVGLWALCGFAVALIWALVFYSFGPHYLAHTALLSVTIPLALLGRHYHYAITWFWSAAINSATYAFIGLAAETIRRAVQPRRPRLNH